MQLRARVPVSFASQQMNRFWSSEDKGYFAREKGYQPNRRRWHGAKVRNPTVQQPCRAAEERIRLPPLHPGQTFSPVSFSER